MARRRKKPVKKLRAVPASRVRIFKVMNRRSFAAVFENHLIWARVSNGERIHIDYLRSTIQIGDRLVLLDHRHNATLLHLQRVHLRRLRTGLWADSNQILTLLRDRYLDGFVDFPIAVKILSRIACPYDFSSRTGMDVARR